MVNEMVRLWKNVTFEEILRELGLFKVKKSNPTSVRTTSTGCWKEVEKIKPDSSWRSTGRGQEVSECMQFAIWKQITTQETAFRYNEGKYNPEGDQTLEWSRVCIHDVCKTTNKTLSSLI